jgi:hypothetical protein
MNNTLQLTIEGIKQMVCGPVRIYVIGTQRYQSPDSVIG